MTDRVQIKFIPGSEVSQTQATSIWDLVSMKYVISQQEYFDMLRRRETIMLFTASASSRIVGVAGIDRIWVNSQGQQYGVGHASLTYIDACYRGRNLIQRCGAALLWQVRKRIPTTKIYWLFDAFGYESYMLMARNFYKFWPRPGHDIPASETPLVDAAYQMIDDDYDSERGIVANAYRLARPAMRTPIEVGTNHLIDFYISKNPGYLDGEGLVCLVPLTLENMAYATAVSTHRALRRL